MNRQEFEIAQIIEQFGRDYVNKHLPNSRTLRTLNALKICRTSAMGGHKGKCDHCGRVHISYNSCRNRHCPKCQASKQAFWIEDISERIIDTRYFHIVFTVPEELNAICILDSRKFYNTLFSSVWQSLQTFGYTKFANSDHVIKYLGGYTHRVAISNERIQQIDENSVSFYYKDYRDNARQKLTTLPGIEFLRRFCMHILPKGFVKIRYYGILSNRFAKQTSMYRKQKPHRGKETVQQRIERLTGFDVYRCPYCKKGYMREVEVLPRIRSPGNFLRPKHITIKV